MKESQHLKDTDKLVELLKSIPAFKKLEENAHRKLLRISRMCTYSANEIICKEGDQKKKIYVLLTGSVTVSQNKRNIMTLKSKGDVFGEMSVLEDGKRKATVTAEEVTACLKLDAEFIEILNGNGDSGFQAAIHNVFAKILAYRLRVVTKKYTKAKQEIALLKKKSILNSSRNLIEAQ